MKKLFLLLGITSCLKITDLKAQITLDSTDLGSIGDTIVMVVDSFPVGISVGNTGGPQVWDFTTLGFESLDTFYFLSPSATTNGADFPGSNLALETPLMNPYFIKSDSQVNLCGIFLKQFSGMNFSFSLRYEDYLRVMEFPTNYLTVTTDTARADTIFRDPNFGAFLDSARLKSTIYVTNNFDAYGVINTPSGSDTCLRQKRVEITIDSIWIKGVITAGQWSFQNPLPIVNTPNPSVDTQYVYSWFAKNRDHSIVELHTNKSADTVMVANYQVLDKVFAFVSTTDSAKCNGECSGSATVTAISGIPPYTYLWDSNASNQTTSLATGLCAGGYSVVVFDAVNDSFSLAATVSEPVQLVPSIVNITKASCGTCSDGSITVSASGGTTAYTFLWSNSFTGPSNNNLLPGIYSVTVTDGNACTAFIDNIQVSIITGKEEIIVNYAVVEAYPNPVNNILILKNIDNLPAQLIIFDITGRSVLSTKLNTENPSVSVKEFPEGLYNFILKDEKGGEIGMGRFSVVK